MRYRILGPIEAESSTGLVRLEGGRPRTLLALFLAHRNQVLAPSTIADVLWGEEPPETWRTALQVHVSNLRKALGPEGRLLTRADGYVLEVRDGEVDADDFIALLAAAREQLAQRRPSVAAQIFGEALALWRGEIVGGLVPSDLAWFSLLGESRDTAVEERAAALVDAAQLPEAIAALRAAISNQPFRERLRELLMLALYRAGRQEEALAAYQEARETLLDELGVDPGPALQRLEASILDQEPTLDPGSARPFSPVPAPATSIIGREPELATLQGFLQAGAPRLLTIAGPGGVGKTRLAQEIGIGACEGRRHGVAFVSLAEVTDVGGVPAAIARALGVRQPAGSIEDELATFLADRDMLLILDNFEHVVGAAQILATLLAASPKLMVLATSREPLGLRQEHVFWLKPLSSGSVPGARPAAVELFAERASAAGGVDPLNAASEADVREISMLLDGLPLAIELAAARMQNLSLGELRAVLDDVLSLSSRDASRPARHSGLDATLRWSWGLLAAGEQRLLAWLSTFVGPFTRADASTIGAEFGISSREATDTLERLARKSLVTRVADIGTASAFRLLETVRAFARHRLDELDEMGAARAVHARLMAELCGESPAAPNCHSILWYAEMDARYPDVLAATQHAASFDRELFFRFVGALGPFWAMRGYFADGERWATEALSVASTAAERCVANLTGSNVALMAQRPVSQYLANALAAARQSETPALSAAALATAAITELLRNETNAAWAHSVEVLELLEVNPATGWEVFAVATHAVLLDQRGERREAHALMERALEVAEAFGFDDARCRILGESGEMARRQGNFGVAMQRYAKSAELARLIRARPILVTGLLNISFVSWRLNDASAMRAPLVEVFELSKQLRTTHHLALALVATAGYTQLSGKPEVAAQLLGRSRLLLTDTHEFEPIDQADADRISAAVNEALHGQFDALVEQGASLALDEALELAASLLEISPRAALASL